MKQATGELNMTLVVVLIVAALSVFFFSVIWPTIKDIFSHSASCDSAICECPDGYRDQNGSCNYKGSTVECYIKGNPDKKIVCTWKG